MNMYRIFQIVTLCITALPCLISVKHFLINKGDRANVIKGTGETGAAGASLTPARFPAFLMPVLLALIFIVFLFSRLYGLSSIPAGIHLDEAGITYDALTLRDYGTDRLGHSYPVYPANYGDGNSALYTYLEMITLRFLPLSMFSIRLPAVIMSVVCFFSSFGIAYELYEDKLFALLGPIFVTITPFFFTSERFGLDCNLMLSMSALSLYLLIKAVKSSDIRFYILAGIALGVTLYTYILSCLMIPVFLCLMLVYLIRLKKIRLPEFLGTAVPFVLIAAPLFLEQLVNLGFLPEFRFLMTDFYRLPDYRIGEISFSNIPDSIFVIVNLLFGGDPLGFNSLKEFGPFYWCAVPLFLIGLVSAIRELCCSVLAGEGALARSSGVRSGEYPYEQDTRLTAVSDIKLREPYLLPVILLFGISVYSVTILLPPFNTYNSNAIYIVFSMLAVEGIRLITASGLTKTLKYASLCTVFLVLLLNFLVFSEFYFRRQTAVYGFHAVFVSTEPADVINYVREHYASGSDKKIYTEINYSQRDYADIVTALFTETPAEQYREYLRAWERGDEFLHIDNIYFGFPAEFDENEDAVYILGTDWQHIASYLSETGFQTDTAFSGYTIHYR